MSRALCILCGLWFTTPTTAALTVMVSGATGQTGFETYKQLKAKGVVTRALVRNVTKAKAMLGCGACTEAEGIFVGDITKPASLPSQAFKGADTLIICTASRPRADLNFTYTPGASPREIDYIGGVNTVKLALENGVKRIGYVSTFRTTFPGATIDQWRTADGELGYVVTYHGVFEAYMMNAVLGIDGGSFTITKAGGLLEGAAGQNLLRVYHNDEQPKCPSGDNNCYGINRADVAMVMVAAVTDHRALGANLRFDLDSDQQTPAPKQVDWESFFAKAKHVVSSADMKTVV